MTTVVVTGASGSVGRRLVPRLAGDAALTRVVGIDAVPSRYKAPSYEHRVADLAVDDLGALVADARPDCVVHLAFAYEDELDEGVARQRNVEAARCLLAALDRCDVAQLVVVSSAVVYGASPTNPVPLTEEAPLAPEPGFPYAVQRAEVERLVAGWAEAHPDVRVAVLRPTTPADDETDGFLSRALAASAALKVAEPEPPVQFVHVDDIAAAVDLARTAGLDGIYNVAPDGWIPGDVARALSGPKPRIPLPAAVATRLARWSWGMRLGPVPPGLIPYTSFPWVVANDRIKAAGWAPNWTNEEAFVAGHEGSVWSTISPKRKQELALGATGALGALVAGGVAVGVRAALRRQADGGWRG